VDEEQASEEELVRVLRKCLSRIHGFNRG
jgi:hypothetical protein